MNILYNIEDKGICIMSKIKIKLNIKGVMVEIENLEYNDDIFEFLNDLSNFIDSNDLIMPINASEPSLYARNKYGVPVKRFAKSDNILSNSEEFSEDLLRLAKDCRIDPNNIQLIYDFEGDSKIPSILTQIKKDTRVEQQRTAILLILYANKMINKEDKITSYVLTPLLTKSNIDPSESSKAFRGEHSKFVKIDGKTYRITTHGILEARKLLSEINENLAE